MPTLDDRADAYRVIAAYKECGDELQTAIHDMLEVIRSSESTDDEKMSAADTIASILTPGSCEASLGEWKSDPADEAAMDAQEESFAERVRTLMEQQDITQSELARRIGIGQPAVSLMLRRECRPQSATIDRIAKALDVKRSDVWNEG